ncbi:ATP-binding protein [Conexibacter sp. SYSU D00693]|uniref:sensor histidine kinase n=1 Tax=Conexibacter sp. SYSU D00693 TaxID=2812560 RepID=UPI00196ABEB2|nr:ATP-binding protein [Conexibacter sp. SYSU D00693]
MGPARRPPLALGVLAASAAVAVTTGLLFPLREVAPVISLGVVYLLGVLGVAAVWGAGLGVATAVASALAFNLFHIEPTGRLTIAQTENWVALGVFLVTAVVAGSLAQAARSRALEAEEGRRAADLSAELARVLLSADDLEAALAPAAQRIAAAFGLDSAAVVREAPAADPRRVALPVEGHGWLVVPAAAPGAVRERLARAVVPTLAALLDAGDARARLLHEVVETRALRRSEDIKTTLLRTVSHDLRTPLTAIAASAEALASPALAEDERRELAQGAADQARGLSALVDDLLDLSRLEAGRAEPRRQWLALDEVLDAAADGLPRERLELRLGDDLPLLHADPVQLGRAFHNLLDNAVRHSGGQPVTVRAQPVGAKLVVRVTDRGPGVPEAEHERIFQPFYRADHDRPRSAGSGLGLAIVRGFVESNGGTVHVESHPGAGASFVVKLPLVEGAR